MTHSSLLLLFLLLLSSLLTHDDQRLLPGIKSVDAAGTSSNSYVGCFQVNGAVQVPAVSATYVANTLNDCSAACDPQITTMQYYSYVTGLYTTNVGSTNCYCWVNSAIADYPVSNTCGGCLGNALCGRQLTANSASFAVYLVQVSNPPGLVQPPPPTPPQPQPTATMTTTEQQQPPPPPPDPMVSLMTSTDQQQQQPPFTQTDTQTTNQQTAAGQAPININPNPSNTVMPSSTLSSTSSSSFTTAFANNTTNPVTDPQQSTLTAANANATSNFFMLGSSFTLGGILVIAGMGLFVILSIVGVVVLARRNRSASQQYLDEFNAIASREKQSGRAGSRMSRFDGYGRVASGNSGGNNNKRGSAGSNIFYQNRR